MATLDTSIEAIIDAVVEAIEAETQGGLLSDVKSVVRGDRARPMPELPSVWVVPQAAQQQSTSYGEDTWRLPLSIAALVKGDDPAAAGRQSQRISALAQRAARNAEAQMEGSGANVTKIEPTTFDPTARSNAQNRTLFWTEATIDVTFEVDE